MQNSGGKRESKFEELTEILIWLEQRTMEKLEAGARLQKVL